MKYCETIYLSMDREGPYSGVMAIATTFAGALSMLANAAMFGTLPGGGQNDDDDGGHPLVGLLGAMIAPIAATLVQAA